MSAVGKGVTSSSVALLLKARGLSVTSVKIDCYINLDAGTMNPTIHGEVFVLSDGDETDQDMGNYERFLGQDLSRINYITTGRVYQEVIRKERALEYGGRDVEVIPDIPEEVIRRIKQAGKEADADVVTIEIGGTIGEYQNILFIEAARMLKDMHPDDVITIMVSYLPVPPSVGEMKTKPTQYAARSLNSVGVQPDLIVARSTLPLDDVRKNKIARFCNIDKQAVVSAPDSKSIYDVPLNFEDEGVGDFIMKKIGLRKRNVDLKQWRAFARSSKNTTGKVKIAVVGKYFNAGEFVLSDAYVSVLEAIKFSSYKNKVMPEISYVDSARYEEDPSRLKELKNYDGVLIPGGFGSRGIEGKLKVVEYVRKNKIPYLGLCYGMQLMVIEYARNVVGLKQAHTKEVDPKSPHLVIDVMEDQKDKIKSGDMGGTMRLGSYVAKLKAGTIARVAYRQAEVTERHRHRYEVNPEYVKTLEDAGLVFSGTSPDGLLMEIAELPKDNHPFFVGTQFHPEFLARPLDPHPLFTAFIKAAKN